MAKTIQATIEKQHPLTKELRVVLDNPNASLGELASVVQRTLAELHMLDELPTAGAKAKAGSKGAQVLSGLSKKEIARLRDLATAFKGAGRRSVKSR